MFKKFSYLSFCAVLAFGAYSCSDSDPEDPDSPDTPDKPDGTMEVLTPAKSKQFLESTATEFLNKFKAADQRELIELAAFASEKYSDLEAPSEFEISPVNPAKVIAALAKAFSQADASRAGSTLIEYTYKLDFSQFTGIYEPGFYSWVKKDDSKDIIFRFDNAKGQKCELKAVAAGGTSDVNVSYEDWDYDYDDDDNYYEYDYINNYELKIPKNLAVTLTVGSTTLINAKVVSDINVKGHRLSINADIAAANLNAAAKLEGNDSKATQTSSFSVSGETIVTTSATLNGSHLCDIDYFEKNEDDDELALKVLKNGTATASVLNKVSIDANVTFNADIFEAFDNSYWGSWDNISKAQAQAEAQAAAKILDKYFKTKVRYNNTATEQASLTWGPAFYEYYYGYDEWECYLEPLLKFKSDGSTYSFEEYFERGFGSVENLFEDILDNYQRVWNNALK